MARKARPNNRTTLRYISPDDSAIGVPSDTPEFQAAWKTYNDTFDESVLKIDPEKAPGWYYIRPITLDAQTKFFEALADDDTSSLFVKAFSPSLRHIIYEFVDRFVIGCARHEEVTQINSGGEMVTQEFTWEVGSPRPEGLVESIMADQGLTFNLFMFAVNASRLSDREKKL